MKTVILFLILSFSCRAAAQEPKSESVPPAVVLPDRTTAYRLTLDGFLFWGDNTPCESPLPAGTKVINAPTPPHYHPNDNRIPAGMRFDPIGFLWTNIQ